MENRELQRLEMKYWAGETTLPEEEVLQREARAGSHALSADYKRLVGHADESRQIELDPGFEDAFWARVDSSEPSIKRIFTTAHFIRYAAVGIILVGLGLGMWDIFSGDQLQEGQLITAVDDTYDSPEQAFEEAKKALMFASQKLNKGVEPVEEIKRFHTTKMSITGQPADNN